MTPEQAIDRSRTGTIHTHVDYYWRGVLVDSADVPWDAVLSYEQNLRPVSQTNPLRPDGTRAPGNWEHKWFDSRHPHTAAGTPVRWTRTYSSIEMEKYSAQRFAPLNGDPGRMAETVGVPWVRGNPGDAFPYDLESLARTRTIAKLMEQKLELGTMLGEAAETARGITSLCGDVLDFIETSHRLVKGGPKAAVEVLERIKTTNRQKLKRQLERKLNSGERSLVNRYLEFQFGIKPLVGDIADSSSVLDELVNDEEVVSPGKFRVASGAQLIEVDEATLQAFNDYNSLSAIVPVWRRSRCRISCVYEVDVQRSRLAQQLGATNSFSVGWELIPFSWLGDYVIGTGDWIKSLFPVEGANFFEGSITYMQEAEPVGNGRIVSSAQSLDTHPPLIFPFKLGRMQRDTLGYLLPAFRPAFKRSLGVLQMGNSLAAFRQLLRG